MATRWRDPIPTEVQNLEDQNTDAGKPQPYPIDPRGSYPEQEDVRDPVGEIELGNADVQHREIVAQLAKLGEGFDALLRALLQTGFTVIRVDGGVAGSEPRQSTHVKIRVQTLIISRATAGDAILNIGTASYPFTVLAAPVNVPFPIVIERGVDISMTGDGRLYLVAEPE